MLDAYRRELLPDAELGLGTRDPRSRRIAFRASCPGALALVLADHIPWHAVFLITALFMLPGIANTLLVSEPLRSRNAPRTLTEAVVEPFHEFITRAGWHQALLILGFIFLYNLGASMAHRAGDAVLSRHGIFQDGDRTDRQERRLVGERCRRPAGRFVDAANRHQPRALAFRRSSGDIDSGFCVACARASRGPARCWRW